MNVFYLQSLYKFDSAELEEESKTNFWELFPDYLLDFRHLTASKTLHHKTQMKQDFEKLQAKIVHDPTIIDKHQQIIKKQQTKQQLDDVLLTDENILKSTTTQHKFLCDIDIKTDNQFSASLSIQDIKEIFKQHLNIFSTKSNNTISGQIINEISESLSSQHRIAGILTELLSVKQNINNGVIMDKTIDEIGHISYLLSTTDLYSRFTSRKRREETSSSIDVYTESVPSYIRIVEKPLQSLSIRIASLLTAYPSHSVLLQISELCCHLSSLSIRSPIMKVLTGLELLLTKSKSDWEDTCAAKHTSIQKELNPIFKLIGFWRKLELQSWSAIFKRKEEEICDAAITNWFYLYSLIHTETITDDFIKSVLETRKAKEKKTLNHEESFIKYDSSLNPKDVFGVKAEEILAEIEESINNPKQEFCQNRKSKIFLQEMFNHLNEFLENSPIGEHDIRLTMIQSFYQQINYELYIKYDENRIKDKLIRIKLLRMIGNLIDYHSQFHHIINKYKKDKFDPIKSKLKELVKFSKWDLRNYWKLRESAQKSHRKLAKLCNDWKIALKRSVAGILAEIDQKETNETAKNEAKIEFGTAELDLKILKKNKFLKRILSKKRIKPDVDDFDIKKHPWLLIKNLPKINSTNHKNGNLNKLIQKIGKLQNRFYEHSHWHKRILMQNDLECLCSSIIITTKEYANKEIPLLRKQRILSTLLQHFKQNGLNLFAPGDINYLLPNELFLNNHLSSNHILSVIISHQFNNDNNNNNNDNNFENWLKTLTEKSHNYYHNVIHKMCQIRSRKLSAHSDIYQEKDKCYGVTERLFSFIKCQRDGLNDLLKQISTLQQWYINIKYELKQSKLIYHSPSKQIQKLFWEIRDKLSVITQSIDTLTAVYTKIISICKQKNDKIKKTKKQMANQIFNSDDLAHFQESIPDFIADEDYQNDIDCSKINDPIIQSLINSKTYLSKEYNLSLTKIKQIKINLNKYQKLFDEIITYKLSPQKYESMYHETYQPFWSSNTFYQLTSINNGLCDIYNSLQSLPCFNNLNIKRVQFESLKPKQINQSKPIKLNKDYINCYESVIQQIQFCIQDVINLVDKPEFNPPNTSNNNDDDDLRENLENKYFAYQQQSFVGIVKAFHGKEIAHKLEKLIILIHSKQENYDKNLINESLNNLLLMIKQIIEIGRFAFNHNIQTHKSFCKLQYILTSLFNGLFVKGFCKKDEDKDDQDGDADPEGTEIGDGVGMADGKGIEDVSNEMENETQVEGLQNENQDKPQSKDKNDDDDRPKDDDNNGIDMEQDFDGELQDFKDQEPEKKKKDDSDSEDEIEDIDREMSDIDFNKSQIIDERMWGSDDEQEEKENNKNQNENDKSQEQNENNRNENQELDTNDKYSQVQAKENLDENDDEQNENDQNKNKNKSDCNENDDDDDDEMNDKQEKEEQTARLEFADPLEDLDENVSDEEAMITEKNEKNDENAQEYDEQYPRKEMELKDDMDIEFSDSDDGNDADDDEQGIDENKNDDDQFDPKLLEQELAEKEKEMEQEKMEDLQRGAGEIMPPNQAKDDELDFLNDSDSSNEDDDLNQNENGDINDNQEMMDIDKEEEDQNENGNALEKDSDADIEQDEDIEDVNHPHNPDLLKPNMPETNENKKDENENGDDTEMKKDEDEKENDKDEAEQNEDPDEEDTNLETEQNGNDNENNDEAMGVEGGMGDTAPMCDDENNDDDIDMQKEENDALQQQLSDIYGDDQQTMMQDTNKGEWRPMNNQQQNKKDDTKKNKEEKKEMNDKTNPFRSLGDALSEWKQRLDLIEQNENAEKEEIIGDDKMEEDNNDDDGKNDNNGDDADKYGYIPDDMEVDNEQQALGDARDDDDITHLPNISDIHNDQDEDDIDDDEQFQDQDEFLHDNSDSQDDDKFDPYQKQQTTQKQEQDEEDKNDVDSKTDDVKLKDLRITSNDNDEETKQSYLDYLQSLFNDDSQEENDEDQVKQDEQTETLTADITSFMDKNKDKLQNEEDKEVKRDENDKEEEEEEKDGPTAVEIAALRNELDKRLRDWHESSSSSSSMKGDEIWRNLCMVTSTLSQQLCEELRTILEPLEMTKLGGDFRTGKRINMKKVIPYIASQFRKDKIWLRRCKPNKRNYQILICIDDSQSMRENSSGRLALESLCILSRALNKLEVGSMGVLSFGQAINLLHSLHEPFNDQNGSFVCSQFTFNQKETKYQDLIATIINVLSNNDKTWQNIHNHMIEENTKKINNYTPSSISWDGSETLSLVFIISDARIQQDRKELQQLIRIANERKQIILLIVVDTENEETSITNVKSIHVDPITNKVNITNYLDDFPFPYYVLLKDIQTLPNVVADSLRQWFELVRQSS